MSAFIALIAAAVLAALDQLTKYLIVNSYSFGESVEIIPGLVDFTYIHNNGAAFGMLQDKSWILLSVSSIVILLCVALLFKKSLNSKLLTSAITLVMAGGIGNLIDRIFNNGSVIDFIDVQFIDFPVFNFADCCVTIGAGLIILDFIRELVNDFKKSRKVSEEDNL